MSNRSLNASTSSELGSVSVYPILLAVLEFPSGTVRAWSGVGDFVWNEDTYTGVGNFGSVTGVEDNLEGKATGITFELSGLDSTVKDPALSDNLINRDASLYFAVLDSTGTLVGDPVLLWLGSMDKVSITSTGDTQTISLNGESRLIDQQRKYRRVHTDVDQKTEFPGDQGLEFITDLVNKTFPWGRSDEKFKPL